MMEGESLLQGWLQQQARLACGELQPDAPALLPLPLLHITNILQLLLAAAVANQLYILCIPLLVICLGLPGETRSAEL